MRTSRSYALFPPLFVLLLLLFSGCATAPVDTRFPKDSAEYGCAEFFAAFDRFVEKAGVRDAGASPIQNFAYLRVDRFLASFAGERLTSDAFTYWMEQLRRVDAEARNIEWSNLPEKQRTTFRNALPPGQSIETYIIGCGKQLAAADAASKPRRQRLSQLARRPDAYTTWQRVLGVYGLTRYAAKPGLDHLHEEMRSKFRQNLSELPVEGRLIRYRPPVSAPLKRRQVGEIIKNASNNPLEIPEPSDVHLKNLFEIFSPVWEIDTKSSADRIGRPVVDENGTVSVDTLRPVVYKLASHTRYRGQVLLQLNYVIWFPARPKEGLFDLFGGWLDGIIWRVTLSTDGQALAYDSIHPCGCYYVIFPSPSIRARQPSDGSEPVLAPKSIPLMEQGQRVSIRLASNTHFIQQISAAELPLRAIAYEQERYTELRSLPGPKNKRRSLFDPVGLIPESSRLERFLLWPFGVPNAGAMRQWGTHAIAFVGRRHFDDSHLLEGLLEPRNLYP